ncbi:MAG TPA: aminodeoxychorismate synthase component I [Tenuifilaceae bacterium]|nr:aminodeoxychorismate synthase component I [Tenuifilaceae bacterium]HOZ13277.1 aminodeoxychorismate synthase component I [Tenuifilaceae bacterium]HPI45911.1 aminodeoxychorismate synthase component I [Tenuifilaceae bacterium]HPN20736.1 aminodeoxychorismate synthase component I [Tenuifilaceae bacterium]
MRTILNFDIQDFNSFAENLISYIGRFNYGILLRGTDLLNVSGTDIGSRYDLLVGLGSISVCSPNDKRFANLSEYLKLNDWVFGYFSYDLKNELEDLKSNNFDALEFPELFFFQPEIVFTVKSNVLSVYYFESVTSKDRIDALLQELMDCSNYTRTIPRNIIFKSCYTKQEYLETIHQVKKHIARGDIYEMNLCQEFYTEDCSIEPAEVFNELYRVSPTPFAAFLKVDNKYLMSASPERYIRKEGDLIISQPIKGTAPRKSNAVDDEKVKLELSEDTKERAENVMIVDLVRNDLSKVATRGSVKVNELCGIYTFPQVHQMISTVTCKLQPNLSLIEPIRATFPMGSMTGAPKFRAMQLIEEFERTKRGLFSGAVGYFAPNGDFDFNVVIRSLLYNKENRYLSFTVGGAITFNSEPEKEYNECLLKAKAILTTLNATIENAG